MKIINDVFWFIGVMAAGFLLLLFGQQDASAEVRIGYGANCGIARGNGFWEQQGQPYDRDNCSDAAAVQYVGRTPVSWLDWSIGAAYRNGTSIKDGTWLSDNCYWLASCSPPNHGTFHTRVVETKSKAITLTINPTWRQKNSSVFAALGVSYFNASTTVEGTGTGTGSYAGDPPIRSVFQHTGPSLYLEVGATYRDLFLTTYFSPHEHGGENPDTGQYGLIVGLRFK
jgi:hypothetical protein